MHTTQLSLARPCTTNHHNRWTLTSLALLGALCLVVLAGSYSPSYAEEPIIPAKAKELSSLQTRVKALGNNTQGPEWAQVVKDFDAWAKKYAVQLKTQTQAAAQAATGGFSRCPPSKVDYGMYCYLDVLRSGGGKCVYRCVPIQ